MARPRRLGLGDEVVVLLLGDGVECATEEVDNLLLEYVAIKARKWTGAASWEGPLLSTIAF